METFYTRARCDQMILTQPVSCRLLRKRFRIERERGGSAISTGIEPEPFDHLPGRKTGIERSKILWLPRVRLFLLFLSKPALLITLIPCRFMP